MAEIREVLGIATRAGGPLGVRAVKARAQLAHWQVAEGRPDHAMATMEEQLALQLAALRPESDAVLDTRSRIADLRLLSGDAQGAVAELRAVLAATGADTTPGPSGSRAAATGPGGGATRRVTATRRRLAHALEAAGDLAGAAGQWELLADGRAASDPDGAASARRQTEQLRDRLAGLPGQAPAPPATAAELSLEALAAAEPGSTAALKAMGRMAQERVGDEDVPAAMRALIDRWQAALTPAAPAVLTARAHLAEALGQAGDRSAAAGELAGVVEVLLTAAPADPARLYASRRKLAHWQEADGDYRAAAATVTAALDTQLAHSDPSHPLVLALRARLADIRMHAGDPAAAAAEYRVLIEATGRVKGANSAAVMALDRRLAAVLVAAGRAAEAAETLRAGLDAWTAAHGPDNPEAEAARRSLAFTLQADADVAGSLAVLRETVHRRERRWGRKHPETLAALRTLAYAEHDAGEFAAAVGHLAELHARRCAASGEEHPDTRAVAGVLAEWRDSRAADEDRARRRTRRGGHAGQEDHR
ncbi:tetratricopeptide repeat protein [Streptomyces poriticola]|uniref:tetratricopeptide repeat protein n=1 Tax=Streptomyces poriticola TaxID=3120506 RepID=UPI002FCE14CD